MSEPCYGNIKVVTSAIKSDHKAVIAWSGSRSIIDYHKAKSQQQYRVRTPDQHAALLAFLSGFTWDRVLLEADVQKAFDIFYDTSLTILNNFYPLHVITISNRDPLFVTPRIKALLRQRNLLMRKGAIAAAESISKRIGERIIDRNRATFTQLPRGSKELWSAVRKVTGKEKHSGDKCKHVTVEAVSYTHLTLPTKRIV